MLVTKMITNKLMPKPEGVFGVCGEFTIILDDVLCIHKMLVINGQKGLFVAFPNDGDMRCNTGNKKYLDIVHPTNTSLRREIENKILSHYNELLVRS